MVRSTKNLRRGMLASTLALSLGIAGSAWAKVPDESGQIHGCYGKLGGLLRIVDTSKGQSCSSVAETAITWNQKGQQGERGPTGPEGQPGPAGPAGPQGEPGAASTVYTSAGHQFLDGANYQTIATLDLPAGRYLLTGKGQALNQQNHSDVVSCNVYDSASRHLDASTTTVPDPTIIDTSSYGALVFERAIELPEPRTVRVECIGGRGLETIGTFVRLTASTVGAIVEQGQP